MASSNKDNWDKAEVLAKVLGSIAVPLIIAGAAYAWNNERTERQANSERMELALDVLRGPTLTDGADEVVRDWANQIVQNPDFIEQSASRTRDNGPGLAVDSVICNVMPTHLKGLAQALVEDGGPMSLSKGRDVLAIIEAACNYQRSQD